MYNFIVFTGFLGVMLLCLKSLNNNLEQLSTSISHLETNKIDELVTNNCGRLIAANKNLQDSYNYLLQTNAKYRSNIHNFKFMQLYNLLQMKSINLRCQIENNDNLRPSARRVISHGWHKSWPKWVSSIKVNEKES